MDNIVDNIVSNEEYIVKQAPKRRISIQNYDTLPNIK